MSVSSDRVIVLEPSVHADAVVERDAEPHRKTARIVTGSATLLYVRNGHGAYRTAGRGGAVAAGTLIAMPPGFVEFEIEDAHETLVLAFREPAADGAGIEGLVPALERRLDPDEQRVWSERIEACATGAQGGRFDDAAIARLVGELEPLVWRGSSATAESSVRAALREMRARLAEPLRLDDVAGAVGYATNHLNDLTRLSTGRSLGAWLTEMRMARARAELAQTDLAVAEVGLRAGYPDPAYFARAFRRVHGVAPAAWRIAMRPDDERHGRVAMPFGVFKSGLPPEVFTAAVA